MSKFQHETNDLEKVSNKASIEIAKFDEALHFFETSESLSIDDHADFLRVHANALDEDYNAQKRDFLSIEATFDDVDL